MEDDVHQMVANWIETSDGKVPPKRQNCQRPVRLVALLAVHRGAPEVVPEKVSNRNVRPEVLVVPDCGDVIENEFSG
jgi:hypothetical protein